MTDTSERGLESLIVRWLVERNHYEQGSNDSYSREFAVDEVRLLRFLNDTQKDELMKSRITESEHRKREFFARLQSEIARRGIVDVLRNGVDFYPSSFVMFWLTPSGRNTKARELHGKNIFSVTRQLRFLRHKNDSVDLCIFINGLPVVTVELKNRLTGQNVDDAVAQYMKRDCRELLFSPGRCAVHFAADDMSVKFCSNLAGKESAFLPFDKGYNGGAGNPPNPDGIMTAYLWQDILTREKLTLIVENFAAVVGGRMIFPRYHQLDAVTRLLADVRKNGVGRRYLIQHSAGSGKSNSIAWLAHQLAALEAGGRNVFDSVLVVTDRKILDRQIRDTVKGFAQVGSAVIHAEHSGDLRAAIQEGRRIITTTVQKFPYIVGEIGSHHRGRNFAVIIDEAHSSQGGEYSADMNRALSAEDEYDDAVRSLADGRMMQENASWFAFTATPRNTTLEIFGTPYDEDGTIKRRPFHVYTMKQAIDEGFILDVLQYYTPVESYYSLVKIVADDKRFDRKKAMRRLKNFADSNPRTIAGKAAVMVQHFHEHVFLKGKIGGRARAMIVTPSIHNCIEYYNAVNECLAEIGSPYKAIIAFSGTNGDFGHELTSSGLNGFPDSQIPAKFREDEYRLLVVADMFQTGFDEPLLHTMYIDKELRGVKAVQTLSRLNRTWPGKSETFILDFANDAGTITDAFSRYYRTAVLSGETDPDELRGLEAAVMDCGVFTRDEVRKFVELYTGGASQEELYSLLDKHAVIFAGLDTESQMKFKKSAKRFVKLYNFLGAILPCSNPDWERLCIFLTLLLPKLPAVRDDELPAGLYDSVDLESYRIEAKETMSLAIDDEDKEISPGHVENPPEVQEPEKDLLSEIVYDFNRMFSDASAEECRQIWRLAEIISADGKCCNALSNSGGQAARVEIEEALRRAVNVIASDSVEFYGRYQSSGSFKKWLTDTIMKAVKANRMKSQR